MRSTEASDAAAVFRTHLFVDKRHPGVKGLPQRPAKQGVAIKDICRVHPQDLIALQLYPGR